MTTDGFLMAIIKERTAESAEQDQTARKCGMILLYTHRKTVPNISS